MMRNGNGNGNTDRKIRHFLTEPIRPGDPRLRRGGTLLLIGGHEDKEGDKIILRSLAERVGSGRLVLATLASESPREMLEQYEPLMRSLGVAHIHHLRFEERTDGAAARVMRTLDEATAVFFTGGDQLRITSLLGDTPAYSRIFEIFANGGTIAGTSAGASVLSETMMVGGAGSESHRIDSKLRLAPGLGLVRDMVIDQHFAERGRIGRLLGVVGQNPRVLGIGIDEDTAIEVRPNIGFRVLGSGGVTVLNGSTVTHTNIVDEEPDRTMSIANITLHVLTQGDRFDLRTRTPELRPADEIEDELGVGTKSGDSNGAHDDE